MAMAAIEDYLPEPADTQGTGAVAGRTGRAGNPQKLPVCFGNDHPESKIRPNNSCTY
jgi:hypothetical protein